MAKIILFDTGIIVGIALTWQNKWLLGFGVLITLVVAGVNYAFNRKS